MARGRPIVGADLVDRLDGPLRQKKQLRILLGTIAGRLTIAEACAALGVRRSRLHQLRWRVLEAGFAALGPRRLGRPRLPEPSREVKQLEARIRELELALQTTVLHSRMVLTMPHLSAGCVKRVHAAGHDLGRG
jgi:hypothetical protein